MKCLPDDFVEMQLKVNVCSCIRNSISSTSGESEDVCVLTSNKTDNTIELRSEQCNVAALASNIKSTVDKESRKEVLVLRICDLEKFVCDSSSKPTILENSEMCSNVLAPHETKNTEINCKINDGKSEDNMQAVTVNKNKRKITKMINIKMTVSAEGIPVQEHLTQNDKTDYTAPLSVATKQKSFSKSADDVSVLNENSLDDNIGSVELIIISDKFTANASRQTVHVLKNGEHPTQVALSRSFTTARHTKTNTLKKTSVQKKAAFTRKSIINKKEIIYISDDFRRNSLRNNIVVVSEPTISALLLQNGRRESLANGDFVNGNTSHAFRSYDEDHQHLESKELTE